MTSNDEKTILILFIFKLSHQTLSRLIQKSRLEIVSFEHDLLSRTAPC